MIVEPLQYAEEKHAQDVRSFHVVKRLHDKGMGTNPARPASRYLQL
jgi:hypothetical protein